MRKFCVVTFFLALGSSPSLAERGFKQGAIAAAHPAASAAGALMLQQGGNAVDAVVAGAFTMAVVGPYHSGLGGGGFAVSWSAKEKQAVVLDFREVAPAAATREMFLRDGAAVGELSTDGALSVAVPGAVLGYLQLHERYGKLPRAVVLAPAIAAAKNGFPVGRKYQVAAEEREACLQQDPEAARIFLRPDASGTPRVPALGTILKQPELARTLEALAKSGAKSFYEGPTAKALADSVVRGGGRLTLADLKAYRTRDRAPLWGSYRGHKIATMPPPSAGGIAVLQVLGVLERTSPLGLASREVSVLHHYLEAARRSYVDRAKYLGDPAFNQIPLQKLISPAYFDELKASIDPKKATASAALLKLEAKPSARPEQKNTTHLSVVDGEGNAVALTTTINYLFGSCLVGKGTGVLLNDEMDDFASQPGTPNKYGLVTGEPNAVAPGKVPLSSMSPTLVFQKEQPDQVLLVVGSPGGSTIPTTVIQVISNVIDAQMDVTRAVGFGRIHHQWLPDAVRVDAWGLEPETQKKLEAMGHVFQPEIGWGDAEAVRVDPLTGLRSAASDPRGEGAPAGTD
ncbi:MAG: Gamma-glutamyltranspeptidase [Myxococcaceae bacterium]|nr:Gamma-glutamyltranspeptidase [Myxococcaceae bacterium]